MHATPTADMELEQRLDAYARARLSLAPDAAARASRKKRRCALRLVARCGDSTLIADPRGCLDLADA